MGAPQTLPPARSPSLAAFTTTLTAARVTPCFTIRATVPGRPAECDDSYRRPAECDDSCRRPAECDCHCRKPAECVGRGLNLYPLRGNPSGKASSARAAGEFRPSQVRQQAPDLLIPENMTKPMVEKRVVILALGAPADGFRRIWSRFRLRPRTRRVCPQGRGRSGRFPYWTPTWRAGWLN